MPSLLGRRLRGNHEAEGGKNLVRHARRGQDDTFPNEESFGEDDDVSSEQVLALVINVRDELHFDKAPGNVGTSLRFRNESSKSSHLQAKRKSVIIS